MRMIVPAVHRTLAVAACALLVLAGCGGSPTVATSPTPGGGASGRSDACRLVTKAEAESILGASVTVKGVGTGCNYTSTNRGAVALIAVVVTEFSTTAPARQAFDTGRKAVGGSEKISGLGDAAYFLSSINQIWVLEGRVLLNVSVIGSKDGKAAARKVAEKAVSRL